MILIAFGNAVGPIVTSRDRGEDVEDVGNEKHQKITLDIPEMILS